MAIKKEWKVLVNSNPDSSYSLVSLYDLVQGTQLDHDIILYNSTFYVGGNIYANADINNYNSWAIELGLAIHDSNAQPYKISIDNNEFPVYPKSSYLRPDKYRDLYTSGINDNNHYNFLNRQQLENEGVPKTGTSKVLTSNETTISDIKLRGDITTQLYVYKIDSIFSSTMKFDENKTAYNRIILNSYYSNFNEEILKPLIYHICDQKVFGESIYNSIIDSITNRGSGSDPNKDKYIELAKNLYLWVKAPTAADYIKPKDYNQDLNQTADVIHNNLLISNRDDNDHIHNFNRFDEYLKDSDEGQLEASTRPYTPKITPIKDFLSDNFYVDKITGDIEDVYKDSVKSFINTSRSDDSNIGSVLTHKDLSPSTYYDPLKKDDNLLDLFDRSETYKKPTIIGKYGNIFTDGRIISPTIDELWYTIKKLISGYSTDKKNDGSTKSSIITGTCTEDTSLTEVVANKYSFIPITAVDDNSVDGDPLDWQEDENHILKVSEWVSQPESFSHSIYCNLTTISGIINTHYKYNYKDDDRLISSTGINNEIASSTSTSSKADGIYGPRSKAPYSLRELEALIKGNRFNIENNFEFNSKTYAITGKFGIIRRDDNNKNLITAAGSLYQMHREYNANIAEPNTYFKLDGDGTNNSGMDATFGDLQNNDSENKLYLLDENNKKTNKQKLSKMPLLAKNYGKSESLTAEQGSYSGSDVYMAADGTWRYKAEHMRLPILREAY